MCNVYGLLGCVWSPVYPTCMIQFCISLWMFISSLLINFLKPKPLKPILFYFYLRLCWLVLLVVWEQFLALTQLILSNPQQIYNSSLQILHDILDKIFHLHISIISLKLAHILRMKFEFEARWSRLSLLKSSNSPISINKLIQL